MKTKVLPNFHNSHTNDLRNATVIQVFEQQVASYGNQTAICCHDQHITYNELNAKANVLANYLRECGVQRNTIVALYLERSIEFIIAMLAVIKAGGAYLPIDVDGQINRNKKILEESNPVKILTSKTTQGILKKEKKQGIKSKLLEVTSFFQENSKGNRLNPLHVNSKEDMIYVMYTSGSTGIPKGCMIPHRGVVRLVKNTNYIQVKSTDCVAQMANAAFDGMVFEVWNALLNGASLYIIPPLVLLSLPDLAVTLKSKKISMAFITPALLNLLVKSYPDVFDNFNYLMFGGEKANVEIIKTLVERRKKYHLSNLKLVNGYGPTECTACAVAFIVEDVNDLTQGVPIGNAISHTTTYILDEHLKPVVPGQVGELYLGGCGLALGYLNDPMKTAEKFIPAPWDKKEILYKTGDLVYWQPKTGIMFVNRLDEQVKIRGFRVEVMEVEACILKNDVINQAIVKVEKDVEDINYLVAYVSFHPAKKFNHFSFYQFLKQNLPDYMLPKKIIQVDKIPITANGKIDRKQLCEKHGKNISYAILNATSANDNDGGPSNPIEQVIVLILEKMLGISGISTMINIFDLGVHSLMIADLCVKLNSILEDTQRINIIDLFTYPTIRSLAQYINKKKVPLVELDVQDNRANLQRKILMVRKGHHANF